MVRYVLRFVIAFLLLLGPVWAQTAEELVEKALAADKIAQHEEAARYLIKAGDLFGQSGQPLEQAQLYEYAAFSFLKLELKSGMERAQQLYGRAAALYAKNAQSKEAAEARLEQVNLLVVLEREEEALSLIVDSVGQLKSQKDPDRQILYRSVRRLAAILDAAHRWAEAYAAYSEVLDMAEQLDPEQVPDYHLTLAAISQVQGDDAPALRHFQAAIEGFERYGATEERRDASKRLASFLTQRKRFEEALPLLESLVQEWGDSEEGLDARFRTALVYEGLEQPEKAYQILTEARTELRDPDHRRNLDKYRVKLLWKADRKEEAEKLLSSDAFQTDYQRAVTAADNGMRDLASGYFLSYSESVDSGLKPNVLNRYAFYLMHWEKSVEAEVQLRKALKILGPKRDEMWATLTLNLAESYLKRGELQTALTYFQDALPWYEKYGSPEKFATALNNTAACYMDQGRPAKALVYLERAKEVVDRFTKPSVIQGTVNNALGSAYMALGRYEDGILFCRRAMARHQTAGNAEGERVALFNLGQATSRSGSKGEGFQLVSDAFDMAMEARDWKLVSLILGFLGSNSSNPETKRVFLADIDIILPQIENKAIQVGLLSQKAEILEDLERLDEARESALQVLAMLPADTRRRQAHLCRDLLLRIALATGDLPEARKWYDQVSADMETTILGLSSREARSFMDKASDPLGKYCIALLKEGAVAEAFEVQEKQRSLGLAALTRDIEHKEGRVSPRLLEQREMLATSISEVRKAGRPVDALASRYRLVLDQIERESVQTGLTSKISAAALEEVQASMAQDEAVLQFISDGNDVHLVLVKKRGLKSFKASSEKVLKESARAAYTSVSRYQSLAKVNKRLGAVGELIIQPALSELDGVNKLIIIPSNGLYSIPFAALPIGESQYLIDRFQLTITNSASAWVASRGMSSSGTGSVVAALGNFQDSGEGLTPLPQTEPEARTVAQFLPDSKLFLGKEMNSQRLQVESRGKENLHLATHGLTNESEPLLSGLAFSDRRVTAADIFGWNLSADLAVLSACKSTGYTERNRFLGLTSAFQYAGVRTLVVSLWSVSDEATKHWMEAFYKELSVGAAPSKAMMSAHLATREQWPHPFFWAPFTTWGDGLQLAPKVNGLHLNAVSRQTSNITVE